MGFSGYEFMLKLFVPNELWKEEKTFFNSGIEYVSII
jgi:hypothetical protein